VDEETGVVRTRCSGSSLKRGHEYEIGVSAVDLNGETAPLPQKSPTQSVKILVGERDPQFYELQYVASVPEGSPEQFKSVLLVVLMRFSRFLSQSIIILVTSAVLHQTGYRRDHGCSSHSAS